MVFANPTPSRHITYAAGWLVAVLLALAGAPAEAQPVALPGAAAAPAAEPEKPQATLDQLIQAIENPDTRARLVEALRAAQSGAAPTEAAPEKPVQALGTELIETIAGGMTGVGASLTAVAESFESLPQFATWLEFQVSEPYLRSLWLTRAAVLALALCVGILAFLLVARLIRGLRPAWPAHRPSWGVRAILLLVRLLLDALPIAAFVLGSYGALLAIPVEPSARLVAIGLTNAVAEVLAILAVGRLPLAPDAPRLRLMRISDETANYLYLWLRRFAVIAIFGWELAEVARLLGLSGDAYLGVIKLVGAIFAALACAFVLQNRHDVAQWLNGQKDAPHGGFLSALRFYAARLWHIAAIAYVLASYVIWAADVAAGGVFVLRATGLSIAVLVAARLLDRGTRHAMARGAALSTEMRARFPRLERRANRYLPAMQTLRSLVIWIAALIVVLQLWGFDSLQWLTSGTGRSIGLTVLSVVLVLVLALAAWEMMNAVIERYLAPAIDGDLAPERSARMRTLLPLVRNVVLVFLVLMTGLVILSELGVDTAPLLAGAGVVGLAIGFGSQALVKDVITGLFILLEDTVSVGDVATVSSYTGVVEGITIRSIRLRDLSGSVYTVPWSEVSSFINLTKDYSYYLLDVGIAYRENTDEVIAVLEKIGAEMQAEPAFGRHILEPIEILGVDQFADSAVIIKARIKTRPIRQWAVGREFNRRMKLRFDELGIEIPFPHTTIYFGEDKTGAAPPARVVVGEASEPPAAKPRRRRAARQLSARVEDRPPAPAQDGGDG